MTGCGFATGADDYERRSRLRFPLFLHSILSLPFWYSFMNASLICELSLFSSIIWASPSVGDEFWAIFTQTLRHKWIVLQHAIWPLLSPLSTDFFFSSSSKIASIYTLIHVLLPQRRSSSKKMLVKTRFVYSCHFSPSPPSSSSNSSFSSFSSFSPDFKTSSLRLWDSNYHLPEPEEMRCEPSRTDFPPVYCLTGSLFVW